MVEANSTIKLVTNASEIVSTTSEPDDYDHVGAMQFIIATVLVYSTLGVCCTLVTRIKRSHNRRTNAGHAQDEHIQKYIKHEKYLKADGFKMKLTFECDKTKNRLNEIGGRGRLLDIQRAVKSPDFTKGSVHAKNEQRTNARKTRLGSLVGKMGFSLIYVPENGQVDSRETEEAEHSDNTSLSELPTYKEYCKKESEGLEEEKLLDVHCDSQERLYENKDDRSRTYQTPESVQLVEYSPALLPVPQTYLYENGQLPSVHNSYSRPRSDIFLDDRVTEENTSVVSPQCQTITTACAPAKDSGQHRHGTN